MARGEQGSRERGVGLTIAAAFGVLCLLVLFLVLATTRACDGGNTPPAPHMMTAPEPFPGAFAAAARLGTAACRDLGPGVTSGSHRAELARELEGRGYVAEGDWSPPTAMPAEVRVSGCGRVAAVADGGFVTGGREGAERLEVACGSDRAALPSCGAEPLVVEGQGDVIHRTYLVPGLTASDVEASELDLATLLAHAEAEVALGALGYAPHGEVVVEDLGVVSVSHFHSAAPPAVPDEGCVLWVGVARGLGNATVTWSGEPGVGYMPANVARDPAQATATFGLFACGADSGAVRASAEATLMAPRAGAAQIVYRAYAPPSRPAPGAHTTASPTIASARKTDVSDATLPASVEFVRPEQL